MEDILKIPKIDNTTLKYFVNDKFVGNVTTEQVNQIRFNVYEYMNKTGDKSILNKFHFIGHKDSNDKMGVEIKITMDRNGNFSDVPFEMNHVRRNLMNIMKIDREKYGMTER